MYKTSKYWKNAIYKNVISVLNVYIDDVLINPDYILDLKPEHTLFDGELTLGTITSQSVDLQLYKDKVSNNVKKIRIEYGILVNKAITVQELNAMMIGTLNTLKVKSLSKKDESFEIIPIGEFNVDNFVDNDDGTVTIKLLDNMIKFDADNGYYDASELINKKGYATLGEIAQDICNKKGVELRFYFFFRL